MGNCFSDPSSKKGGQKLGSAPAPASTSGAGQLPAAAATSNGGRVYEPPRTLGGTGGVGAVDEVGDPRARAMRAAEERANAAKKKGVNNSNPKHGQLSAKLEQERKTAMSPKQDDERLMDRGQWN